MGAVALREERQSLTIDSPEAIADLCSEMRFLDRESLRVVLLNTKQHLIKVCTVSQGSVNESLAHPREIFKPVITHSAYSFMMVHNHPSGEPSPSEADMRLTRRILEASRILQIQLLDHVIIGAPAPGRNSYFSFKESWRHRMTPWPIYEIYPLSKRRALSNNIAKARRRTASRPERERSLSFVSRTSETSDCRRKARLHR
jgi:proteasome lid subunit RPN8/RPN11